MRRGFVGLLLPLRLSVTLRTYKSSGDHIGEDEAKEKASVGVEGVKEHLFRPIDLESGGVDNFGTHAATDEEPPFTDIREEDFEQKPQSQIAEACIEGESFSKVLRQLSAAHRAISATAATGATDDSNALASDDTKFHDMLHRFGLRIEKSMRVDDRNIAESCINHMAFTLLVRALLESLLIFRRENAKRMKESVANPPLLTGACEWRIGVLKMYVDCFGSLSEAYHEFCSLATEREGSEENEDIESVCNNYLCSSTIISSAFAAAREQQWHAARCVSTSAEETKGGETMSPLEEKITTYTTKFLTDASYLLEEAVCRVIQVGDVPSQSYQLMCVLVAIERTLSALDKSRGGISPNAQVSLNTFVAMKLCLLMLYTSLSPKTKPQLEERCITALQHLWLKVAPPLERRSSDSLMTHRTVHTSLNIRYLRCREEQLSEDSFIQMLSSQPERAALMLELVRRAAASTVARNQKMDRVLPSMVQSYAVFCRTLLEIEVELYFLACKKAGRKWTVPTDPFLERKDIAQNTTSSAPTWEQVILTSSAVRVAVSSLVELYTKAYVLMDSQSLSSGSHRKKITFVKHPAFCFLKAISTSYFPLLRRHYLDTRGTEILGSCLQVFVLLKQLSDTMDVDGEEQQQQPAKAPSATRVCGTTLSQAAEVAFFLSFSHHSAVANVTPSLCSEGGESVSPSFVSGYVREVLFALDHNTAKQLQHLRSNKILRGFTGVQCEDDVKVDKRLVRRQSQSVLSVVHAHVMHPSFLWMPLHQLQEIFFILSHERDLTRGLRSMEGMLDSESSEAPNVFHVGSGNERPRHFKRGLNYLSLRLYVVSNVLRHLRAARLERPPVDNADAQRGESDVEGNGETPRKRAWARNMAILLRSECSSIFEETEGLNPSAGKHHMKAIRRVMSRLESTIQFAVRHSLLINVKKNRVKHRVVNSEAKMEEDQPPHEELEAEASGVEEEEMATEPEMVPHREPGHSLDPESMNHGRAENADKLSDGTLTLSVSRDSADGPLGFSLNGEQATIRRIIENVYTEEKEGATGPVPTPFSVALRDVGVTDPQSVVGWCVTHINGIAVHDSRAIIPHIKGKQTFSMTISRAGN
uniref:WGS project CAEQ00000000 data, annotated contig 1328 n=1 Tax=Trypanosoma congolense (strain IL3000) TaxID=1068625 RepID=F9W5I3_TRYCI|nr:unnamed protein product [Trypanosoma congolense IL3000]